MTRTEFIHDMQSNGFSPRLGELVWDAVWYMMNNAVQAAKLSAKDAICAVIAEQTPQIADAVLKCRVDADEGMAEAQGEVPEWFYLAFNRGSASPLGCRVMWPDVQSELTRRVEQATADKDKRIAELEKQLAERDAEIERLKSGDSKPLGSLADALMRLRELIQSRVKEGRAYELDIADFRPLLAPLFHSLNDEITKLREQLAEATAEVERLKGGNWTPEEVNNICHNLHGVVSARGFADGCALEQQRLYGCAPDADDVVRLREQLAEATKPVKDVDWETLWTRIRCDHVMCGTYRALQKHVEPVVRRERAARVAAERKLAELREFVRTRLIELWYEDAKPVFTTSITDAELDKMLAAFLAEKGKVGQ